MPKSTTILVVEDDDAVRDLMVGVLLDEGYRVLEAEDGPSALELVLGPIGRLDLVICDVNLPGLGGGKVVGRLAESHPELKFLYISGYMQSSDELTLRDAAGRPIPFLPKPFVPSDLIRAVSATLHRPLLGGT